MAFCSDPGKFQWRQKYGSRLELMRVKDMRRGAPTGWLADKSDVTNDVTLGTGRMKWPMTNLFLTLLDAMGAPTEKLGNGRLDQLNL